MDYLGVGFAVFDERLFHILLYIKNNFNCADLINEVRNKPLERKLFTINILPSISQVIASTWDLRSKITNGDMGLGKLLVSGCPV